MQKFFMGLFLVVVALGLQGCASQKELLGMGESKTFTVEGKGDWKKAFKAAVVKVGGELDEVGDNRLSAVIKDHRVKVVANLIEPGVIRVTGSLATNSLMSFYSLTDEAHDGAKEIASLMGERGFVVRASK